MRVKCQCKITVSRGKAAHCSHISMGIFNLIPKLMISKFNLYAAYIDFNVHNRSIMVAYIHRNSTVLHIYYIVT